MESSISTSASDFSIFSSLVSLSKSSFCSDSSLASEISFSSVICESGLRFSDSLSSFIDSSSADISSLFSSSTGFLSSKLPAKASNKSFFQSTSSKSDETFISSSASFSLLTSVVCFSIAEFVKLSKMSFGFSISLFTSASFWSSLVKNGDFSSSFTFSIWVCFSSFSISLAIANSSALLSTFTLPETFEKLLVSVNLTSSLFFS